MTLADCKYERFFCLITHICFILENKIRPPSDGFVGFSWLEPSDLPALLWHTQMAGRPGGINSTFYIQNSTLRLVGEKK